MYLANLFSCVKSVMALMSSKPTSSNLRRSSAVKRAVVGFAIISRLGRCRISSGKKSPSDSTEADFSPRRFQSVYGDGRLAQRTTGTRSNAECRANEPRVVVWDRTRARSWVDAKVKQFN
jgi:hypothetical protein